MMYDIAIIGGGIAGLYFASLLKDKKVLLIEEHKNLGPRRCSGIVSNRINNFFELPKTIIEKEVNKAIISYKNLTGIINFDSIVLDKERLEWFLLREAKKCVEIKFEKVNKIFEDYYGVIISTKNEDYRTKYLVGCDGPNSLVRRIFIKEEPKKFYFGKFCYSKEKSNDYFQIFFDPKYSDLFSWIAPRKGKVEYGLISEKKLSYYYENFLHDKKPKYITDEGFGVIPTGMCKCSFDKGILIGNSCGQTKPLTGGGIIYSLIAAKIAAKEFNKDKPNLKNYEKECKKIFGKEIKYQLWMRKIYSKLSDKKKEKLVKLISKSRLKIDMDFPVTDILRNHKMKVLRSLFSKV